MVLYAFSPGTREGERRRRICEFEVSLVYTMSSRSAKDIYIYIYIYTPTMNAAEMETLRELQGSGPWAGDMAQRVKSLTSKPVRNGEST